MAHSDSPAAPRSVDGSRSNRAVALIFAGLVVANGLAVLVHRHLFADGAFYLLDVIARRDFIRFVVTRFHVHVLCEGAMVLAATHGGFTFAALSWLFGASLMLGPLVLWGLALVEIDDAAERRTQLGALLVLSVLSGFFAISEIHWAAALFTWMSVVLARRGPLGAARTLGLVLAMFVALRAYESFALLGPLLSLAALRRLWPAASVDATPGAVSPIRRRALLVLAAAAMALVVALGVGQAAIAVAELIAPRDPNNRTGAIIGPLALVVAPATWLFVALACVPWPPRRGGIAYALALAAVVATFAWPALLSVRTQSAARALNMWIPLALAIRRAPLPGFAARLPAGPRLAALACAAGQWQLPVRRLVPLAIFALGWNAAASFHWARFADQLRATLRASAAPEVAFDEARRAPFYDGWAGWGIESASVALQLVDPSAPRVVPPPGEPLRVPVRAFAPDVHFRPPLPY